MNFKCKIIFIVFLILNICHASSIESKKGNNMSIKNSWNKLTEYWLKNGKTYACNGINESEIVIIKELYDDIPESYIKSLKICNPIKNENGEYFWIDSSGWGILFDAEELINRTKSFRRHEFSYKYEMGAYQHVYGDIKNPNTLVPKQWIPIYDWNGDYIVAIDMLSDNKGQIIVFCLEDSIVAKWTDSYEEWFELAVDEVLKYGELRVETIENILQIPQE